jgi:hypothetical protein
MKELIEKIENNIAEAYEPPPGYVSEKAKSKVTHVSYDGQNGGLQFHLASRVHDDYLKDEIGSVSPGIEKTYDWLMKAKYTEEEISQLFKDARAYKSISGIKLEKPITIHFTRLAHKMFLKGPRKN